MTEITFAVHAQTAEVFWQSWITAGICAAPQEYTAEYRDHIEVRDWGSGQIEGKHGWFANCRVTGSLVAEMTYGLAQEDSEGNPLGIFDRTWAVNIFSLVWRDRDEATNFPAGYVRITPGGDVIAYSDMSDISTPHEVRQ